MLQLGKIKWYSHGVYSGFRANSCTPYISLATLSLT